MKPKKSVLYCEYGDNYPAAAILRNGKIVCRDHAEELNENQILRWLK